MSEALAKEVVARMRPLERKMLLEQLAAMISSGELRLGEAVRILRTAVLGVDRDTFAKAVRLSKRALVTLEDDPEANPTLQTLQRVFAPFGGSIGLVFPRMEEPAPVTEEQAALRESLRAALSTRRRRRPARE